LRLPYCDCHVYICPVERQPQGFAATHYKKLIAKSPIASKSFSVHQ
jgi:hypothetical protein